MKTLLEINSNLYGSSISFIDIDETTFHTYANVNVKDLNGNVVKSLNNQEFNTHQLGDGESYDFSEFQDSKVFNKTSEPIEPIVNKIQNMINSIKRNGLHDKVIFLTARSDFNDKELFLKTFRANGIDVDDGSVYIERSGNLTNIQNVADRKRYVMLKYLQSGEYTRVRMIDDDINNLRVFKKLGREINDGKFGILKTVKDRYPRCNKITFFPLLVDEKGKITNIKLKESALMERLFPEMDDFTFNNLKNATTEYGKPVNSYTKWLGNLILSGKMKNPFRKGGPIYDIRDAIKTHKKLNQAKLVKPIMSYTSWEEFEQDLENVLNKQNYKSNSELDKIAKNGAKIIYDDGETKVLQIKNWEAARKYGKGTRWCTSSSFDDKYFKHYTEKDWQQLWYVFKGDKKYGVSVAGESYYSPNISLSIFNEQDDILASVNQLDANLFGNKKEIKKRFLNQDLKTEAAKLKDFDLFWLIYKLVIKTFFPELYSDVVKKLEI